MPKGRVKPRLLKKVVESAKKSKTPMDLFAALMLIELEKKNSLLGQHLLTIGKEKKATQEPQIDIEAADILKSFITLHAAAQRYSDVHNKRANISASVNLEHIWSDTVERLTGAPATIHVRDEIGKLFVDTFNLAHDPAAAVQALDSWNAESKQEEKTEQQSATANRTRQALAGMQRPDFKSKIPVTKKPADTIASANTNAEEKKPAAEKRNLRELDGRGLKVAKTDVKLRAEVIDVIGKFESFSSKLNSNDPNGIRKFSGKQIDAVINKHDIIRGKVELIQAELKRDEKSKESRTPEETAKIQNDINELIAAVNALLGEAKEVEKLIVENKLTAKDPKKEAELQAQRDALARQQEAAALAAQKLTEEATLKAGLSAELTALEAKINSHHKKIEAIDLEVFHVNQELDTDPLGTDPNKVIELQTLVEKNALPLLAEQAQLEAELQALKAKISGDSDLSTSKAEETLTASANTLQQIQKDMQTITEYVALAEENKAQIIAITGMAASIKTLKDQLSAADKNENISAEEINKLQTTVTDIVNKQQTITDSLEARAARTAIIEAALEKISPERKGILSDLDDEAFELIALNQEQINACKVHIEKITNGLDAKAKQALLAAQQQLEAEKQAFIESTSGKIVALQQKTEAALTQANDLNAEAQQIITRVVDASKLPNYILEVENLVAESEALDDDAINLVNELKLMLTAKQAIINEIQNKYPDMELESNLDASNANISKALETIQAIQIQSLEAKIQAAANALRNMDMLLSVAKPEDLTAEMITNAEKLVALMPTILSDLHADLVTIKKEHNLPSAQHQALLTSIENLTTDAIILAIDNAKNILGNVAATKLAGMEGAASAARIDTQDIEAKSKALLDASTQLLEQSKTSTDITALKTSHAELLKTRETQILALITVDERFNAVKDSAATLPADTNRTDLDNSLREASDAITKTHENFSKVDENLNLISENIKKLQADFDAANDELKATVTALQNETHALLDETNNLAAKLTSLKTATVEANFDNLKTDIINLHTDLQRKNDALQLKYASPDLVSKIDATTDAAIKQLYVNIGNELTANLANLSQIKNTISNTKFTSPSPPPLPLDKAALTAELQNIRVAYEAILNNKPYIDTEIAKMKAAGTPVDFDTTRNALITHLQGKETEFTTIAARLNALQSQVTAANDPALTAAHAAVKQIETDTRALLDTSKNNANNAKFIAPTTSSGPSTTATATTSSSLPYLKKIPDDPYVKNDNYKNLSAEKDINAAIDKLTSSNLQFIARASSLITHFQTKLAQLNNASATNIGNREKLIAEWNNVLYPLFVQVNEHKEMLTHLEQQISQANFTQASKQTVQQDLVQGRITLPLHNELMQELSSNQAMRLAKTQRDLADYTTLFDVLNSPNTGIRDTLEQSINEYKMDSILIADAHIDTQNLLIIDRKSSETEQEFQDRFNKHCTDFYNLTPGAPAAFGISGANGKFIVGSQAAIMRFNDGVNGSQPTLYTIEKNSETRQIAIMIKALGDDAIPDKVMNHIFKSIPDLAVKLKNADVDKFLGAFNAYPPTVDGMEKFLREASKDGRCFLNKSECKDMAKLICQNYNNILRNPDNSELPNNKIATINLKFAKDFINTSDGSERMTLSGPNKELIRGAKLMCAALQSLSPDNPNAKWKYSYVDPKEVFREQFSPNTIKAAVAMLRSMDPDFIKQVELENSSAKLNKDKVVDKQTNMMQVNAAKVHQISAAWNGGFAGGASPTASPTASPASSPPGSPAASPPSTPPPPPSPRRPGS